METQNNLSNYLGRGWSRRLDLCCVHPHQPTSRYGIMYIYIMIDINILYILECDLTLIILGEGGGGANWPCDVKSVHVCTIITLHCFNNKKIHLFQSGIAMPATQRTHCTLTRFTFCFIIIYYLCKVTKHRYLVSNSMISFK